MQVGAKKLCDEVAETMLERHNINQDYACNYTYMSSRGEMKMSLREMTYAASQCQHHASSSLWAGPDPADVNRQPNPAMQ